MREDTVLVPGARRVEATLDSPDIGEDSEDTDTDDAEGVVPGIDTCVVAAPPHPEFGGHRGDRRLTAVSEYLVERDIACLRFDYGDWDEGYGEREDTRNALRWAAGEFERVGLFGYSFGATMSLLAAASISGSSSDSGVDLGAVCVLAPHAGLEPDLDPVGAVGEIHAPLRIVVGVRDQTVDWEPVVEAARAHGHDVVELQSDHHFVGQNKKVGTTCGEFLSTHLG